MTEYRYNNVAVTNLPVVATKISRAIGIMPNGLSDSGNTTVVIFSSDLTAPQKTILDALMAGTNLDDLPLNTGNTTYFVDNIEAIKGLTGLDFDIYPTPGGLVFQFTKALTTQEKNTLKNSFVGTLRQI